LIIDLDTLNHKISTSRGVGYAYRYIPTTTPWRFGSRKRSRSFSSIVMHDRNWKLIGYPFWIISRNEKQKEKTSSLIIERPRDTVVYFCTSSGSWDMYSVINNEFGPFVHAIKKLKMKKKRKRKTSSHYVTIDNCLTKALEKRDL